MNSDRQQLSNINNPFGGAIWYKPETDSTMEDARRLIKTQGAAAAGTIVVGGFQSRGRGRFDNRLWESPPGQSLMFTIITGDRAKSDGPPTIAVSLRIGLGLATFLGQLGLTARVKWPNDILVNGQKVAGILVQTEQNLALIGLGLNIRQTDFGPATYRRPATSLLLEGLDCQPLDLLGDLLRQLDAACRLDPSRVIRQLESLLFGLGRLCEIEQGGNFDRVAGLLRGTILGLSATGALRLLTAEGERLVYAGE